MSLRRVLLLLASLACLHAAAEAPTSPTAPSAAPAPKIETGPAYGWVFPVFTDKEGYHLLTLRGTAAHVRSADQIDVTGFSAIVFSGDAAERVDTVLLSPQATFFPNENRAAGASTVRMILSGRTDSPKDDVEVTGRGWTYDNTTKKVVLAHDVRVTFNAQLHDILK